MELFRLDAAAVGEEEISLVKRRFPKRFARAMRFANREDGLCVIAAGVLLYRKLGIDESRLLYTPEGKPYIEGGQCFSISHSGGRCVLAVGRGSIGVDLEKLDESSLIAAPAALTEKELRWMKASPLERFHILWTRKESVYKAVGGYKEPGEIPALDEDVPEGLFVRSAVSQGFALSVCSSEEPGELSLTGII